jgi:hypothetical protein
MAAGICSVAVGAFNDGDLVVAKKELASTRRLKMGKHSVRL